ncbi:hypothetical protein KPL74_00990 [Bacillus sp. NP157]|nr:hypothetical protein KPL74_00990 [Bacillus sp. NP157]
MTTTSGGFFQRTSWSLPWRSLALVACCTVPQLANATQQIDVQLSSPYLYDKQRASIIHVEIANVGDEDVSLLLWDTPFAKAAGRLPKPLFDVTDIHGKELRYAGRWVNIGRLHLDDFVVLHPGERRSGDVDLRPEYDFGNGGAFAVRYTLPLGREPDPSNVTPEQYAAFRRNTLSEVTSNETLILIDGPVIRSAAVNDNECRQDQLDVIYSAKSLAFQRTYDASAYMHSRYPYVKGSDGKYHTVFEPHPRYERWFGSHGEGPVPGDEDWKDSDNGHAYIALDRIWSRMLGGGGSQFKPQCGCPGYPPNSTAWAEEDSRYTVHFCDLFFKLPEKGWPASRMGVVAHEFSHFTDGYSAKDYEYGVRDVEELAKKDRWKTVRNADSFEFFIMDTTPYDEPQPDAGTQQASDAGVEAESPALD